MRAVGAAWATMASLTRSSTSSTVAACMALRALMVSSSGSPGPAPTRVQVPRRAVFAGVWDGDVMAGLRFFWGVLRIDGESGLVGKSVDLRGRRIIKKKKNRPNQRLMHAHAGCRGHAFRLSKDS